MNQNYIHTITLYNCLKAADNSERKDIWYRHVMTDCFYKAAIVQMNSGTSAGMNNTYTVRIPESERYRPYAEWMKLSDTNRKRFFTLRVDDIVVYGSCPESIGEIAAAQLLVRYKPDAFRVTAVSDNTTFPIGKHYRLGG